MGLIEHPAEKKNVARSGGEVVGERRGKLEMHTNQSDWQLGYAHTYTRDRKPLSHYFILQRPSTSPCDGTLPHGSDGPEQVTPCHAMDGEVVGSSSGGSGSNPGDLRIASESTSIRHLPPPPPLPTSGEGYRDTDRLEER